MTDMRELPLVALVILDGWGLAPASDGNAVTLAQTPVFDALWERYPHTVLHASGEDVGLPAGQIGNSEVGHLNLGAGRVVFQDLPRITQAIEAGELATNRVLQNAFARAKVAGGTVHVIGLCSTGGVHSHVQHVVALARAASEAGIQRVAVHAITDGRDVVPDAAATDLPQLAEALSDISSSSGSDARVATVIGRYWAMDRDRRWDRTQKAYDALVSAHGTRVDTVNAAIERSYAAGVSDEFLEPWIVARDTTDIAHDSYAIHDGDVVIFANFRPDRARQLCHALSDAQFDGFQRQPDVTVELTAMTVYDQLLGVPVLFAEHVVTDTLADVIARTGAKQLHVAETEKYAHVTYFFNGGLETEHRQEQRILVPSPRDVATYDEKPEMSAREVSQRFCNAIADPDIRFAIINFANPDMVGHTGSIPAAVAAVETVDAVLADVVGAVRARGGACFITADHGNAEEMLTLDGKPQTAHTTNLVPVILALPDDVEHAPKLATTGKLGDVAPTLLDLLGIEQPSAMSGASLVQVPVQAR